MRAAFAGPLHAELPHVRLDLAALGLRARAVVVVAAADGDLCEALVGGDFHEAYAALLRPRGACG